MFKIGQKLTVIGISESMAHTIKREIIVDSMLLGPRERRHYANGPLEGYRVGTYKPRGKRKLFHLDLRIDDLVLDGWDLPVKVDSEIQRPMAVDGLVTFSFTGNACLNLGVEEVVVRDYVENRNLNPYFTEQSRGLILLHTLDGRGGDDGIPLYPEIEIGSHGPMDRIKEKRALQVARIEATSIQPIPQCYHQPIGQRN